FGGGMARYPSCRRYHGSVPPQLSPVSLHDALPICCNQALLLLGQIKLCGVGSSRGGINCGPFHHCLLRIGLLAVILVPGQNHEVRDDEQSDYENGPLSIHGLRRLHLISLTMAAGWGVCFGSGHRIVTAGTPGMTPE